MRPEDFFFLVGHTRVEDFSADRVCNSWPEGAGEPRPDESRSPEMSAPSFLFFFDQMHLTKSGRANALDVARDLVNRLVTHGARAAIVSSASRLETFVPLTDDRSRLLQGLDRLRDDPTQQDTNAQFEDSRARQIAIERLHSRPSLPLVRRFADDESLQARRSEQRLGLSLGVLGAERPPRGAFYFGDTLRQNAGQHYFGVESSDYVSGFGSIDFDRLVRDALGFDVHLFPVLADALAPDEPRRNDAQATLRSLGLQTGGEAFVRGDSGGKIAARVHQRFDCMYVLSFRPEGLPTDKTLGVTVRIARAGAKASAQGLIVIPSASARKTARILSAFTLGTNDAPDAGFSVSVIFLSVDKRGYRALVQVLAPPIGNGNAAWDLGASLFSRDSMRDDFAAHLTANVANVPVVLEKDVTLGAGPYEIIAVGQLNGDRVLSSRIEGVLPTIGRDGWVSPIAAVQEGAAAFSRNDVTRTSGTVIVRDGESVNAKLPVAFISVVCRDGTKDDEVVLRTLSGNDSVSFDPIHVIPADRCIQVRDVIPAMVLDPGRFTYSVQLKRGDAELQSGSRRLVVGAGPDVSGRASTASPAAPPPRR
jgi:hypothetical protein